MLWSQLATCGLTLYEAVEANGVKAVLANPLKMRAIASAKIKNDKVDARVLASLLRGGLVAECYVPPRDVRELRALVRHRVQLVKSAGMVKNLFTVCLTGMALGVNSLTFLARLAWSGLNAWSLSL